MVVSWFLLNKLEVKQMKSKSLTAFGLITFCMLFTVATNTCGEGNDSVVKRIGNLEMQVSDLNSRVLELEKKLENCTTKNQPVIQTVPAGKDAWRKLNKKMSKEQVKTLLGEPDKIDNFGNFEVWNYNDYSKVQFNDNGYVTGWHEPD
jgi:hypothetical protein